jgi:CheY-like chemotaxis protein
MHDEKTMAREGFAQRMILRMKRASGVKSFLVLLAVGYSYAQLSGATNSSKGSGFETPPPQPGSVQWEKIQRIAKERQELYRQRVSIPGAVAKDVPRADGAYLAYAPKTTTTPQAPSAAVTPGISFNWLLAAACVFGGVYFFKKLAPDFLDNIKGHINPWALAPATDGEIPAKVRAEEEPFSKFLTAFRSGPLASPRNGGLEQVDPVKSFYAGAATRLGAQRKLLQDIGRESRDMARQKILTSLRSEMSALKDEADFPEVLPVWQVASVLEGLLKHLAEKMGSFTPSTLRAVTGGVDLLDELCVPGLKPDLLTADRPLKFLIVDDDLISRQALSLALKKTFGQPDLAVDGETGLDQASQQAYDVIFLDVQMPGMDGFELCTKIHDTAPNRTTPVVFVTGVTDFDARAQSVLSGGNDLMGKPFLTFEVTVKALTLGLQGRLRAPAGKPSQKIAGRTVQAAPLETFKTFDRSIASPAIAPQPPAATAETVTFTNANLARRAKRLAPSATCPPPTALSKPAPAEPDKFAIAFLERASTHLGPLRELCQKILQSTDEDARQAMLVDAFLRINSLTAKTDDAGVHPAYQMSVALEGLFRKLLEDAKNSTASTLATVASAMDLLNDLCVPGLKTDLATNPPIQLLVVDDDLVACRALVGALQTAFKKPESAEIGEAALALAAEKSFDVIFLDVVMPGMDGFEVCSKIRETVPNRATPVVFVTGKEDFDARTRMTRSGGNELLGKPFLTAEITVKALTFALRGRLEQLKAQPVS